jgi:hypothetical protein
MIKKLTLASVTTMALLFIPAQAEGMKCQAGKCGAGMTEKSKSKSDCKGGNCQKKGKSCKKGMKKGMGSPLLMHLPSPMRMLMKMENDPKLALTAEQKTKLEAQRNETMPKMMKLKEEIKALQKEIKAACKKNVSASGQKANVEKLAVLKTQATMTKLTCIDGVKATLTKEQQDYMKELRKAKMAKMKAKIQGKMNGMKKEMKCQAGKCGAK